MAFHHGLPGGWSSDRPHALGLISDPESVEHLAEIGVILLMFLIGLEFSLSHILKNVGRIFTAGILQLGSTIGFVALFSSVLGYSMRTGMVLGILVGLSSTAIILKW